MKAAISMEWIKDIAIVVTTGIFTIIGVIIGAKMSGKEEKEQKRREILIDTYSNFFSSYLLYIQKKNVDSYRSLATYCEKLQLIGSKNSGKILTKFLVELSKKDCNIDLVYSLVDQLRDEAKKEVRK